jgi:putative glutamine amidotransferase
MVEYILLRSFRMRPIIGIPAQADYRDKSHRPIYGNNRTYVHAVESAGGIPILIPMLHDLSLLEGLFDHMDGLLLSGGVDIQPHLYHEQPHPQLGEVDEQLDELELFLTRRAMQRDMPILGICRGIQLLNVALGGSLFQDIEAQCPGSMRHSRRELPRNTLIHSVSIEEGSRAEQIFGANEIWINSLHHQSVKDPGQGAHITGRAEDGVAELLEAPGYRFVFGIQGHPEELYTTEPHCVNLFAAFIQACSVGAGLAPAHTPTHL